MCRNDTVNSFDILGQEQYTLLFTTAIRPPDIESGEKTSHRITFDEYGKITTHWEHIGITPSPVAISGGGTVTPATVSGSHPTFTVNMKGSVYAKPLRAAGWVAFPIGPFVSHDLVIDYDVTIEVDVCQRKGRVTGKHDGYPSYTLRFGGAGVVYDFQQMHIGHLMSPMDITVNKDFNW
jgi:hypothetical protein